MAVAAATGFFDGVHTGHRAVLQALKDTAAEKGLESEVVTFWPHPRNVLQQDASSLRLLNSIDEKKELILGFGIDRVTVVPFTRELSRMTAREFIREYLIGRYGVTSLVVGYDHRMGSGNLTRGELMETARGCGLDVVSVGGVERGGMPVSSTKIRRSLESGDVVSASCLLGYRYRLHGVVVSGDRIGRTIGFPTANMLLYEPLKLLPGDGVYHVKVTFQNEVFSGICNIGGRPTVTSGKHRTIETHILDFDQDIYGLDLTVEFIGRIRPEIKFSSLEELKEQISRDEAFVRGRSASL